MATREAHHRSQLDVEAPSVSPWLQKGFHLFLEKYLAKQFDAVAVETSSLSNAEIITNQNDSPAATSSRVVQHHPLPFIVYANHPSWWDPMIAHYLNRQLFPEHQFYAPMDAEALERYQILKRLGFYGVQMGRPEGVKKYLRASSAITQSGAHAIWITPEGKFTDVRDSSAGWMPGLAHLCQRLGHGYVMPVALEYVFWNEPRPVCLASIGPPQSIDSLTTLTKEECSNTLQSCLRSTQTRLKTLVIQRDPNPFTILIKGRSGPKGLYGAMRRLTAVALGRRDRQRHGEPLQ